MLYNILIAEDDVFISEHLKHIITEMNHNVCGIVDSEQKAITFLENNELPDLALLDIQMHGKDQGVMIANRLNKLNVPFLFITSFSDKNTIQSAVKEMPVGYIVKPFLDDEIRESVTDVLNALEPTFINIKLNREVHKIYIKDILYLMSSNVYVEIFTTTNRFVCRLKLLELQNQLPSDQFIKVHRSYVVNKEYVQSVSKNTLEIGGDSIPISRGNQGLILDVFKLND
jgi:DNA-binding LytR/AlgR family response regulator